METSFDKMHINIPIPCRNPIDYLLIPCEIIIQAIKQKKINQLKLFVGLKSMFNGQFVEDNITVKLVSNTMDYKSVKTYNVNLKWLIKNRWVTYRKGYCILRSFSKFKSIRHLKSVRCAVFTASYDLVHFKPFIYGAAITYLMKRKRFSDQRSGKLLRNPYMKRLGEPVSFNMPLSYLMKVLDVSKATASNYKKLAAKMGYIQIKKDFKVLDLSPAILRQYKKYSNDPEHYKLRYIKGQVCYQRPDKISSTLEFRKKRLRSTFKVVYDVGTKT